MSDIQKIIQTHDPALLVNLSETLGRKFSDQGLTSSQIRNVFGQVRQIEAMWRIDDQSQLAQTRLHLLKPRLSYQAAKENKAGVQSLAISLTEAIDAVFASAPPDTVLNDRFRRFTDFFEALLAYHRTQEESKKGH